VHAGENFNYQFYNVGPDNRDNRRMAENFGIQPVQVQVVQEDEIKYQKAYMGAVLLHGDATRTLSTVTSADDLEYRLTSAMEKLQNKVSALLNLEQDVRVKLYLSSSLETIAPYVGLEGLSELPERVKAMVEELNPRNYGKLEFRSVDPGAANAPEIPSDYQLQELSWPELPEAGIQAGSGRIGLVLEHGEEVKNVSLLNIYNMPLVGTRYELIEKQALQEAVNQNLHSLLGINQTLGYLAGHGTPPVGRFARAQQRSSRSLGNFEELAGENYTLKQVRLEQGIPEGLNCLVIAGPSEKFSDYELFQIDQALMRGTNLAVFTDSFKQVRQQQQRMRAPSYTPNNTGLKKLLRHYGLEVKSSIVLDEHCYKQPLSERQGGGERPIYYAPLIKNENINHDLPFMRNITRLVAVQASPLQPAGNSTGNGRVQARRLFSSSSRSWTMSERISFNPARIRPPQSGEEMQRYDLAYLLSGRFSSYFQGKPVPERKADPDTEESGDSSNATSPGQGSGLQQRIEGPDKVRGEGKRAQIFVVGSSRMITDTVLDAKGQSPNSVFVMNVLDQLNGRLDMARLRSKVQRFQPLGETSGAVRTGIKIFAVVGLPVLVILFGVGVWVGRKKRKQRIRAIFE
jgi:hypothetical protein